MEDSSLGLTLLMGAANKGSVSLFDKIIAFNPNVNAQDSNGRTVLHFACRSGNLKMVQRILKIPNVDVDIRTKGGETPLMYACQGGNIFVVGECLLHKCNPFLVNSLRQNARDQAKYFINVHNHNLVEVLERAMQQWQEQVPAGELQLLITEPDFYFDSFINHP